MRRQLTNVRVVNIGTVRPVIVLGRARGSTLADRRGRQRSGGAAMIRHHERTHSSLRSTLQSFALHGIASSLSIALVATWVGCGGSISTSQKSGEQPDSGASTSGEDSGGAPSTGGGDAAPSTGEAGPAANNGAPSDTYPAFAIDVAQVVDNGGPVLAAPVVVTITWSTDTGADTYNAFGDSIGASAYWSDINSEYGVGPAVSGTANHVSITTAPPTTYSDAQLDALVEASAGTTWPA
jgi:hypothetical protein